MKRKVINIDEDKCIGCGLCTTACAQGAIELVDGKAKLISDTYCDGLGKCLPKCPTDAITLVERKGEDFVERDKRGKRIDIKPKNEQEKPAHDVPCGCPSQNAKLLRRESAVKKVAPTAPNYGVPQQTPSQLSQWPVQIKLVPANAPYLDNAHLLVAADCTAFAYPDMHSKFMKNKITLIGCPKLDAGDYSVKLTEILKGNNIKSLTIVRMEVPCCGGLEMAAKSALMNCGKLIPWSVVTISINGEIIED